MKVSEFPGCCGGYVISNFGYTRVTDGTEEELDLMEVEAELERIIERMSRRAFLTIALNTEQREVYKQMLYKHGFRRKGSGYNAPHKSTIYIYIRFNQEE